MKLKNTGNKIVSIGNVVIMPGGCADIVGYDKNASIATLIEMGNLEKVKETAKSKESTRGGRRNVKKTDESTPGTDDVKNETGANETPNENPVETNPENNEQPGETAMSDEESQDKTEKEEK